MGQSYDASSGGVANMHLLQERSTSENTLLALAKRLADPAQRIAQEFN
jgi:hypothetical protein